MKIPDFDMTNKVRALWDSPHRWTILGAVVFLAFIAYLKATGATMSGLISGQPQQTSSAVVSTPTVKGKKQNIIQSQTEVEDFSGNVPRVTLGKQKASIRQNNPTVALRPVPLINGFTSDKPSLSDQYAPYGRMIKCKLLNTIESNNADTPIVALVIEELNHDGVTIFKPGIVEMHGWIQTNGVRNRINSQRQWTAVWTSKTGDEDNGKEMLFTGVALAYVPNPEDNGKWDMVDGSAGLKGWTIDTTDGEKLLAIAARFIEGAGQGFTASTVFNNGGGTSQTVYDGSLQSGLSQGFSFAAQTLAQSMLDEIKKKGVYVRVPAGTMFYIYVTQPLDLAEARVGASRFSKNNTTKAN